MVLSFHVVVDCHKGYMALAHAIDKEHPKPVWLVKTLLSPSFVPNSPSFCQIEVEYCWPSTKDPNVMCPYSSWDTKKVLSAQWTSV